MLKFSAGARVVVNLRVGGLNVQFGRRGARRALGPKIGALEKLENNLFKHLLDVFARLGAALDKHHAVLARKSFAVGARNDRVGEIDLVGDKQLHDIVVGAVHLRFFRPRFDALKRRAVRHVVCKHNALSASIVCRSQRSL